MNREDLSRDYINREDLSRDYINREDLSRDYINREDLSRDIFSLKAILNWEELFQPFCAQEKKIPHFYCYEKY